jgi:oligosaccharide repeat unit polymerase
VSGALRTCPHNPIARGDQVAKIRMQSRLEATQHCQHREIWWANPTKLLLNFTLPIALVIVATSDYIIENNRIGYVAPDYLTSEYIFLFLAGILLVAMGAYTGTSLPRGPRPAARIKNEALNFLFFMCMIGYVVWFSPLFLMHFNLVIAAIIGTPGATYVIRDLSTTTPGITTLTQFGIPYVCIYLINYFNKSEPAQRTHRIFFWIIIAASIVRAQIYSERVAFLELLFPIVLITAQYSRSWLTRGYLRLVRYSFPLLSIAGAPIFFAIFEYSRSWTVKYSKLYDNIFQFAYDRLTIYYVSSLNNICGYLSNSVWPDWTGQFTFRWLYKFPVIGDRLSQLVGTNFTANDEFLGFLARGADPEYNNSTGIMVAYRDFGVLGGGAFLLLFGVMVGFLYGSFRAGKGGLQYLYPMAFYALYEILRIGYFWDGRSVSALFGFLAAYLFWRERKTAQGKTPVRLWPPVSINASRVPASQHQLAGLFEYLEKELEAAEYLSRPAKREGMRDIREMIMRSCLTDQEVRAVRGVTVALVRNKYRGKK